MYESQRASQTRATTSNRTVSKIRVGSNNSTEYPTSQNRSPFRWIVAHGEPPRYSTRSGALSIRTVEPGSRARPSGPFADGFTESDHGALATSENLPVDELLERRVDPGLHLGFLPVLPEPSEPE